MHFKFNKKFPKMCGYEDLKFKEQNHNTILKNSKSTKIKISLKKLIKFSKNKKRKIHKILKTNSIKNESESQSTSLTQFPQMLSLQCPKSE